MPFNRNVTRFVRGNFTAMLLRILPTDPFVGLVCFEELHAVMWVNSAQLQHFGWRPQ
jgi:hypothetical protein